MMPGIIGYTLVLLLFISVGTAIGRRSDVKDAGYMAWRDEEARLHRKRGESQDEWYARRSRAEREFWEWWMHQAGAPWGKTLRGALIGALVGVGFFWLGIVTNGGFWDVLSALGG